MNELYFRQEDFEDSLERNLILSGFNRVKILGEEGSNDVQGNLYLEVFRLGELASRFDFHYSLLDSRIYIGNIWSFPKGKGYGRKIVSSLEETSRKFEFRSIHLIPIDNLAQGFWEHMGYACYEGEKMIKLL